MRPRHDVIECINGGKVEVAEKPDQVWTLLNESEYKKRGLVHWESAFIEDSIHDWNWQNGWLHFYGHSGAKGESHKLILVYK